MIIHQSLNPAALSVLAPGSNVTVTVVEVCVTVRSGSITIIPERIGDFVGDKVVVGVGLTLGVTVGNCVGEAWVGIAVGRVVGIEVAGDCDGDCDGVDDGDTLGDTDGDTDGDTLGDTDGDTDGDTLGDTDGDTDGDTLGDTDDDTLTHWLPSHLHSAVSPEPEPLSLPDTSDPPQQSEALVIPLQGSLDTTESIDAINTNPKTTLIKVPDIFKINQASKIQLCNTSSLSGCSLKRNRS